MSRERAPGEGAGGDTPTIAAIQTVKFPPFWPSDPELWFAQVEAHFTTRRITAERMCFDHVISSLSPNVATEVRDLILKPPEANPYKTLKKQLVKRTAASQRRRLQQLFNAEELGDRKPTQLLRHMQQLLGDQAGTTDATFLQELFLQRLPSNVRMVLASANPSATLQELTELADKVVEVAIPSVAALAQTPVSSDVKQLRADLARLQASLNAFTRESRSRSCRSSRSRHSPSPAHQNPDPTLCWYHQTFRDTAQKCKPPCSKSPPPNEPASRQ